MAKDATRVRLYGLIPVSYRRYIVQSVIEGIGLVVMYVGWGLGWPTLEKRLALFDLPPGIIIVRTILANLPWLLLALVCFKAIELYFMLRAFRRKAILSQSENGVRTDGQAPLSAFPGAGPGRETPHS